MNNKNIKACKYCGEKYCLECSPACGYRGYCCGECEIVDKKINVKEQERLRMFNCDYTYTSKFFYSWVNAMKKQYSDYLIRVKFIMSIGIMNQGKE